MAVEHSKIEWTESTWSPIVGCSRVSEGCRNCYAERQAFRNAAMGISRYDGITKKVGGEIRWTGKVNFVESALDLPLRWNRPRRIFVNSMSDLFHEKVPDEWIDRIFSVMAAAKQHTFQVLTKRPERMLAWFNEPGQDAERCADMMEAPWPLPNVWLGVSVEDQPTADERIPRLLQTPAAVRWVSYEPALGPVDFEGDPYSGPGWLRGWHTEPQHWRGCDGSCSAGRCPEPVQVENKHRLDWIVVGGESGPGARPFDLAWARQTIAQGRAADIPVFVKQLGARPIVHDTDFGQLGEYVRCSEDGSNEVRFRDRKGGDPAEWPEGLKIREYPAETPR